MTCDIYLRLDVACRASKRINYSKVDNKMTDELLIFITL